VGKLNGCGQWEISENFGVLFGNRQSSHGFLGCAQPNKQSRTSNRRPPYLIDRGDSDALAYVLVNEHKRGCARVEVTQRKVDSGESVCCRQSREMTGVRMIQEEREFLASLCKITDQ